MTVIKKERKGYVVVRVTYVFARTPESAIRTARRMSVADSVVAGPCSFDLYEEIEHAVCSNICPTEPKV